MPKKRVKKISKKISKKRTISRKENQIEDKIIQNLVDLQKVHIKFAEKFDNLADQISKLLALFEMSAKSFASQPHMQQTEKDKEFLDKIDKLLDQNKVLAKGLTLVESKLREKLYGQDIERRMQRRDSLEL